MGFKGAKSSVNVISSLLGRDIITSVDWDILIIIAIIKGVKCLQQIKAKSEPVDVPYAMPQTKCNKAMNVGKDSCNLKAS